MLSPAERAARAELAVRRRFLRRLWALPGTRLAVTRWPAGPARRLFVPWHYWWQAQLLDCLTDAELRDPGPGRRRLVAAVPPAIRVRNLGRWSNRYHDDTAWLLLALLRADQVFRLDHGRAADRLTETLLGAWTDTLGGGIPWRRGDVFKNAPANGPAAIALARTGRLERAIATVDWIAARLPDPATGLVRDGLRPGLVHTELYTYVQGVVIGAELELVRRAGRPPARVHDLVRAVAEHLATPTGVLPAHGHGDRALFGGILARYLALVATELPGATAADREARATASRLVAASAAAVWQHRFEVAGLPVFGADWSRPAEPGSQAAELSGQLGAWMLLEAAVALERSGESRPA